MLAHFVRQISPTITASKSDFVLLNMSQILKEEKETSKNLKFETS